MIYLFLYFEVEIVKKKLIFLILIASIFAGMIGGYSYQELKDKNDIAEWYAEETATVVSPHHIRKAIAKKSDDFILVDLRSSEEYKREHIVGAVNIPAYKDPDTSAYGDEERMVSAFEELKKNAGQKDIIVYCYSDPCMTGEKVGNMLAEHGIYVKELGIGWNEWRYHWEVWNHEHEWNQTNVSSYVVSGDRPGNYTGKLKGSGCGIEGGFRC